MRSFPPHIPVLAGEVLRVLNPLPKGAKMLDCTLGSGGHAENLLKSKSNLDYLIGADRDEISLSFATQRLRVFGKRFIPLLSSFGELRTTLSQLPKSLIGDEDIPTFDAVLADLGISSMQLNQPERGFSWRFDSPLDMRMDNSSLLTADYVLNEYELSSLSRVMKKGGLGSLSIVAAKSIISARPLRTTADLAKVALGIKICGKKKHRENTLHPSLLFQAIRMEVNAEEEQIHELLDLLPEVLKPQSKVAFITFHSIEDRIVTRKFRKWAKPSELPAWVSVKESPQALAKIVKPSPLLPQESEMDVNPRSRSARLRAVIWNGVSC